MPAGASALKPPHLPARRNPTHQNSLSESPRYAVTIVTAKALALRDQQSPLPAALDSRGTSPVVGSVKQRAVADHRSMIGHDLAP